MLTDMRDFDVWLAKLRPSIADYKYYIDFNNVFNNVEAIKIPLNILNSLIGSKNIEDDLKISWYNTQKRSNVSQSF